MIILVVAVGLTMLVVFVCCLLEACLLSLSITDVYGMIEKRPAVGAVWKKFKEDIQKPLAVTVILNSLAYTIGASICGAEFGVLFGTKWIAVFSLVFAIVMIQWAEILPKTLGVRFNRRIALWTAVPFKYMVSLFGPLLSVVKWVNRPLEAGLKAKAAPDAVSEIGLLARFAALNKMISREEEGIVARSVKLSSTKVSEIMVDRADAKSLSTEMSLLDALLQAHIHHHTRYPLTEGGNADDIVGYVNMKDIVSALKYNPSDPTLRGIARPVTMVSSTMSVSALLAQLIKNYQHIAVVKDDDGRTLGIVTLEDVLESIVGDIEDEYDVLPNYVHKLSDVRFIAGGGATLARLKEATGFDLPAEQKSINQWICEGRKGVPPVETVIQHGDVIFIVRKIRRSQVNEVIVEKRTA